MSLVLLLTWIVIVFFEILFGVLDQICRQISLILYANTFFFSIFAEIYQFYVEKFLIVYSMIYVVHYILYYYRTGKFVI